jgi:NTE family protein
MSTAPADLISPVSPNAAGPAQPDTGIALCLSGGGYRAMLYHLGALWRLAELGFFDRKDRVGHLPTGGTPNLGRIQRISSVSGGSITSAVLGMRWDNIAFGTPNALDRFRQFVVAPIQELAGVSLAGTDLRGSVTVIGDVLMPGTVNDHVAAAYDNHLFNGATLQDLPDWPRFVINASNLQSGALWRFSKPYIRDWRVGEIKDTRLVSLGRAVAASSAFPPVLAPATFKFADTDYTPNSGGGGANDLQRAPFTTEPTLVDGGVYDNLGLETAYKHFDTLLVGNGGKPFAFEESVHHDWVRLLYRVNELIDNQVGSLRKRLLRQSLLNGNRNGAFWDINQDVAVHSCQNPLPCPTASTQQLAHVATDLAAKAPALQARLINWGYASADAGVRGNVDTTLPPGQFPMSGGV